MRTRAQTPALLKGLIFGPTGAAMTPSHTRRNGKLYRYYISTDVLKGPWGNYRIGITGEGIPTATRGV